MGLIPGTRNFWTSEVRCHYTGVLPPEEVYIETAKKLQLLRDLVNLGRMEDTPIIVRSWYRHEDHPLSVQRRRDNNNMPSQHEFGHAVDIWIPDVTEEDTFTLLCMLFDGVGYYPGQRATHGDLRGERAYWKRVDGHYSNLNPLEDDLREIWTPVLSV